MSKNGNNKHNVIRRIDHILDQLIRESTIVARNFLEEVGIDPDEEVEFGLNYIKKVNFLLEGKKEHEKNQELLAKALSKLRDALEKNYQKSEEVLKEMLKERRPSVQFRNLDDLTEDNIREVLKEIDLVELMERLDEET